MQISSLNSEILFTQNIVEAVNNKLSKKNISKIFILTDTNTHNFCLPLLLESLEEFNPHIITIASGDKSKNIQSLTHIWNILSNENADRQSLLINLGGGMVTDIGGFAASTFKRGIECWNIPTSLLAMIDASAGGKTGINYNDLKNEIGTFSFPAYVFIDSIFLKTLDKRNWLSGFAEMIKHALISDEDQWISILSNDIESPNTENLLNAIQKSVSVKNNIVLQDPKEQNLRKTLNFGHTIGHAFESYFAKTDKTLLHGEAIAAGMICELFLSFKICEFPESRMGQWITFIRKLYPKVILKREQFKEIIHLMSHDKKNEEGRIKCVLLGKNGEVIINRELSKTDIETSLLFYIDLI